MKAIAIAMAILFFNLMMAGVTHANLFETTTYYESPPINAYNDTLPDNISAVSQTQQYSQTLSVLGVLFNTLSWNWIYSYIPYELHEGMAWFVNALNLISVFFIAISFIELWIYKGNVA